MPVAVLCCRHPEAIAAGNTPPGPLRGPLLRSVCADRDALGISEFIASVAAVASVPAAPLPRGRGLLAELTCRPGRQVEAWIATEPSGTGASEQMAGLISLVICQAASGVRHSISWLIVHPEARRRGVGRALVAQACGRAANLAAASIWVECRSDWAEAMAFWRAVGFEERPRDSTTVAEARQPDR